GLRHRRALHRAEGQLVRRGLPGRLHPPDARRARLRLGRDALHRSRRVHRLRRLRRGLPRRCVLCRGSASWGVGKVHSDQRRILCAGRL
ncbi:MAG: Ferredoxin, partial [uncultured Solirubrobacterales bacterium]